MTKINKLLQWLFALQEEQENTNRQMEELNRHMEELHHFTDQPLDDSRAAAEQATHTLNNNMFSNSDMFGGGFGDSGMGMF